MEGKNNEINIMELLLQISNDVSSIKTDITNFKATQKADKENTAKEIADVRLDYKKDLEDMEKKINAKVESMQKVQKSLVDDVDNLKHSDEKKDAKRWRTVIAFIATAFGGMILAKIPEVISTLMLLSSMQK